jgi:2'-5' RNA ligase
MSAQQARAAGGERRLFFALWPDEPLRAAIAAALAGAPLPGAAVAPADWHVTLEFLGQVAETRLDELHAVGRSARLPSAELVLDQLDWWRRPALVVAVGGRSPAALVELQSALRGALASAGFRVDARDYRPHLTLARRVASRPALAPIAPLVWPVTTLALVESTHAAGPRYQPLASWTQ